MSAQANIVVIDYGMGNAGSVLNALQYCGAPAVLSFDPQTIADATHIILPGVGAFPDCMENIERRGLLPILEREVLEKKKPYLGICLGMQILATSGEEGRGAKGLGWIPGVTKKLSDGERLPHVGWNDVHLKKESKLFAGISRPIFYFVHSYALAPNEGSPVAGTSLYGEEFVSAVEKGNIFGVQFHPEKSQRAGIELISNFLAVPSPVVVV